MTARNVRLVAYAFLAVFFAYPLVRALAGSDLDAFLWLTKPYASRRIGAAAWQATLSLLATMAVAVPLALLHQRHVPGRRVLMALHAAPFVLPVFVVVYGIQGTLGPWLAGTAPLVGVVIAHAYYNHGFAARLVSDALDRRPRRLEEAAASLGHRPAGVFGRVTAPLLTPSIASTALLVWLFCFTSFGVVLLMGDGLSTIETLLYQNLRGIHPRTNRAAALGILQLIINVSLIWAYLGLQRRAFRDEATPKRPRANVLATLTAYGAAALALAPAATLLIRGFIVNGQWSLEPWRLILDPTHPGHPAGFHLATVMARSIGYAVGATVLSIALALAVAYGMRRGLELAAAIPLGTSSVLMGFAYLITFGATGIVDLRGSSTAIIITHALVAFPLASRIIIPAHHEISHRITEAASTLAPPWRVVTQVHLPLLRAPLAAAAGLAAAISLGDFGASLILMRPDNMGLAVWVYRIDQPFDPIAGAASIALAGVLMLMAATGFAIAEAKRC